MTDPPTFSYSDLPGNVHLAVNSNRKMKTVSLKLSFVANLSEEVATCLAILPAVLRRGTRRHPDMQQINRYLEGLYGASLSTAVHKIGEWQVVRFRLEVVNERFLPGGGGVLRPALLFLRDLLVDPLEVDGGFHADFLAQEKANHRRAIESLLDSKDAYAHQRLIECMCASEPFRIYEHGSVDAIDAIGPTDLRSFHRRTTTDYPLYVYVAGDVDIDAMSALVVEVLGPSELPRRGGYVLAPQPQPVEVGAPRHVEESMDVSQAKFQLGFRHGIDHADPLYEPLLVMNGLLGGFSHSKLFQNVREKANLCYSIHSTIERTKRLLFIASGIAPEKYGEARRIILEQVKATQDGSVTDDEIAATVFTLLNHNQMLEDNLSMLAEVDFAWRLHGRTLDLRELRRRIEAVRRDDVVAAARRLELDTTYLLTNTGSRETSVRGE